MKGKNVIHFGGFKNHIGLYPGSEAIEIFAEKLKKYKTSKKVQFSFPLTEELPFDLIQEIVEFRKRNFSFPQDNHYNFFLFVILKMEILYIILAFILGAVLAYFILKSSSVSRKSYEELQQTSIKKKPILTKLCGNFCSKIKLKFRKLQSNKNLTKDKTEIKDLQTIKSINRFKISIGRSE